MGIPSISLLMAGVQSLKDARFKIKILQTFKYLKQTLKENYEIYFYNGFNFAFASKSKASSYFYFPNIIKSNKRALTELTNKQTFLEIDISLVMHALQRISKFGLLNVAMVLGDPQCQARSVQKKNKFQFLKLRKIIEKEVKHRYIVYTLKFGTKELKYKVITSACYA